MYIKPRSGENKKNKNKNGFFGLIQLIGSKHPKFEV